MSGENRPPVLLRFGIFEVDLRSGELRRQGVRIKLQEQPFRVLTILLQQPGGLVTRDELRSQIWPADTFVDFDNSLNTSINKLREALGDSAENPRFIETLPRRGYRFLASVTVPSQSQVKPNEPARPGGGAVATVAASRLWMRVMRFAVLGLAGIVLGATFRIQWVNPPLSPKVLRSVQITSTAREKGFLAADGSRVYFDQEVGGNPVLQEVSTEGGESVPLPTSLRNAWLRDISRDGSKLLVTNGVPYSESPLWVVTLPGGTPHRVGDVISNGATWSPDGRRIAYVRGHDLFVVQSDGTFPEKLVTLNGNAVWPRWSPDGKALRFGLADADLKSSSIWEISADGSNLHPLLPGARRTSTEEYGNWTPDGAYYFFISSQKGMPPGSSDVVGALWIRREKTGFLKRVNHSPLLLTNGPMEFSEVVPSQDAGKVFVLGVRERGELVRYASSPGQFVTYLSGISADAVAFSKDSQWATYVAYPESTLWRSKVNGSEKFQLTVPPMKTAAPRWSPDGKRIAFMGQLPGEAWKVYLISSEGGSPQQLTSGEGGEESPTWSPDGNAIAFGRISEPGTSSNAHVDVLDLSTHKVSLLPESAGLSYPRWSPDGRYLACQQSDSYFQVVGSKKLMLFDFVTRQWTVLSDQRAEWPTWSKDGKHIYFVERSAEGTYEFRVRISDHKIERIADLGDLHQAWGPFGPWSGLAPDDSLLAVRDIGAMDIYSLDLQLP